MKDLANRGFTSVELLVAIALAAMLMVAVLGVSASTARTQKMMMVAQGIPPWLERVSTMLRQDMVNSRWMKSESGRLELEGYAGLDPETFAVTHLRVRVEYYLKGAGKLKWLMRRQTLLDDPTNKNQWEEVVCGAVEGLTVVRPSGADGQRDFVSPGAVPRQVQVIISAVGGNLDTTINTW